MNRSGFIKSLATMLVAPSLLGSAGIAAASIENKKANEPMITRHDRLRIYTEEARECRVGDHIFSDMDSGACIIAISLIGDPFIEVRPFKAIGYYCRNPKVFYRMASRFTETSNI